MLPEEESFDYYQKFENIICNSCRDFFVLTSVDGKASIYFEELKFIESNILNDVGASKEGTTKIEKITKTLLKKS